MNISDIVVYSGDLKLGKSEDGIHYAITTDVFEIKSVEEDNGYVDVIDVNTNRPLRARKDCLIKVYGGN
jgi:hypothetical protein